MEYTNDNNKLKVTFTKTNLDGSTYEDSTTYSLTFLNNQAQSITSQRDEMIAAKEAELVEVNNLLSKCGELGITE